MDEVLEMEKLAAKSELSPGQKSGAHSQRGARDADILLLLWETFRTRGTEIDHLLDLSLSVVATAPHFDQKADLEASLKKALDIVRSFT